MRPFAPRFIIAAGLAIALGLTAPACGHKPQPTSGVPDLPSPPDVQPQTLLPEDQPFFEPGADVVVISPDGTVISPPADMVARGYTPGSSKSGFAMEAGGEWADPTEDPRIVKDAIDDHNEDPTNDPTNQDLRPNPNPDQSNTESPYPNEGFNSSIGLGGNVGGGGGPGGFSPFVQRRARGGGGHTGDANLMLGLFWLRDHQGADGSFDPANFDAVPGSPRKGAYGNADGSGDKGLDPQRAAVAALALMAFLSAGYTHAEGEFTQTVKKSLRYLKAMQDNDGCFDTTNRENPLYLYGHALCTMAMTEAYAMTGANMLKGPAQKGADFLAKAQIKTGDTYGGWGHGLAVAPADTMLTGWCVLALRSVLSAGLAVPMHCWDGGWAHLSGRLKNMGQLSRAEMAMILATRLLCTLDAKERDDAQLRELATRLIAADSLPGTTDTPDYLDWHFTSLALCQMGGHFRSQWEGAAAEELGRLQRQKPAEATNGVFGSWDTTTTTDWAAGRVFSTAINCLTLTTPYRYETIDKVSRHAVNPYDPAYRELLEKRAKAAEAERLRQLELKRQREIAEQQRREREQELMRIDAEWRAWNRRFGVDTRSQPTFNGQPVTQGRLVAIDDAGQSIGNFPLRHTDVDAAISGMISNVRVQQTYLNEFKETVEAIYVFPLPDNAAVNEFLMVIGERTIHGFIRERAEAAAIYNAARAAGHTAALLTQERPNIFTQRVANIPPGGSLDVSIRYFAPLKYENGEYTFAFPMVVGPRYNPAGMVDGDSIKPPTLPSDVRSGHDISLTLRLDAGVPIRGIQSVNHAIMAQQVSDNQYRIRLHPSERIPNKDFVLRYRVAGEVPQFGLVTHHNETNGGYFALMVQPPVDPRPEEIVPRELVFVLDVSGSMHGKPTDQCKALMRIALDNMRQEDRFNVITFAGHSATLFPEGSRAANESNLDTAWHFIHTLQGGGGTEFLSSLRQLALLPRADGRMRMVVFLTDGMIGNESQIIGSIRDSQRGETKARYFAVGVGSSPNRSLIERIAENGHGRAMYCSVNEPADRAAERLYQYIDRPLLWDIRLDWGGLPVTQLQPSQVEDLWAGQPIILYGRYSRAAKGTLTVKARRGGAEEEITIEVPVDLPGGETDNASVAAIWARQQISHLTDELTNERVNSSRKELEEQIRALATDYNLVSKYTSFVAVDTVGVSGDGRPRAIVQPVEVPEGMDRDD